MLLVELREGVVGLRDGRTVGYADWGLPDAGDRIIYCHGSPGCRLELLAPLRLLEASGGDLRIIAFDRPGYGLSSFRPYRSFLQWVGDLEQAADRLSVDTFALLGASGGAPYAIASAIELRDRVTRLDLVVGTGPPHATGMEESALVRLVPRNRMARRIQFGLVGMAFRTGRAKQALDSAIDTFGAADRAAMADPEVRTWFRQVFAEATKQGGRASASEAALYLLDWGFSARQLDIDTRLWYGQLDANVPAAVGRWLESQIPGARLTVWPDQGHFTWAFSADCIAAVTNHWPPPIRSVRADRNGGTRR